MNCAQVSGTIAAQPSEINQSNGVRFILKTRYPVKGALAGTLHIPCGVFNATPEQRDILLGNSYRDHRIEVAGKLARTVHEDENGRDIGEVEIIANPNGLLIQRRRR